MSENAQSTNRLLASLTPADFALLKPHLKTVDLIHKAVLFEAGDEVDHVYFPHSGIVSLVVDLAGGETIEAATIGCNSIVGGASALAGRVSLNKAIVQLPGRTSVLDVEWLRKAADASIAFRTTLIQHEQVLFAQAQQSAACNAIHSVEARMARWLLRSHDLCGADNLRMTQEFLAQLLGVRRTSVSIVASTLQQAGLISYRRGRISVTNLPGLQEAACECYGTVKSHYDQLLNGNQPLAG